jgi:hypothetical protein
MQPLQGCIALFMCLLCNNVSSTRKKLGIPPDGYREAIGSFSFVEKSPPYHSDLVEVALLSGYVYKPFFIRH